MADPLPSETNSSPSRPPVKGPGRRSLRPYVNVIVFLVRDSLWRFKGPVIVVLAAGNVALIVQGAAVGLALMYARWLEQGATVNYLGREWEVRTSLELLWIFAGAVAGALVIAALATYLSRTRSLKLRSGYEMFCSRRALEILGVLRRVKPDEGRLLADDGAVLRVVRGDARLVGRVLANLVDGIVSGVTLVVVFGVLLFLELRLTMVLLVVLVLSGGFLYSINRGGAHASRALEGAVRDSSQEYKQTIRWMRGASLPVPEDPTWVDASVMNHESTRRYVRAFIKRLRVTEDARLVSNVVTAVAFFVLIGIFGSQLITTGEGFAVMAVYLVALRRGMSSFRDLNGVVSGINRFYPQAKRYVEFLEGAKLDLRDGVNGESSSGVTLTVSEPALPASLESWEVSGPCRIGLLTPVPADRYSLPVIAGSLLGGKGRKATDLLLSSGFASPLFEPLGGQPLRSSLGLRGDWDDRRLRNVLLGLGLGSTELDPLPLLDTVLNDSEWDMVSPNLRYTLCVLGVAQTPAQWVFLDEKALRSLDEHPRSALLDSLGDRRVVIVYSNRKPRPGSFGEDVTAVIDGERLLGLGPSEWLKQQLSSAVAAILNGPYGGVTKLGSGMTMDEEAFEEDLI